MPLFCRLLAGAAAPGSLAISLATGHVLARHGDGPAAALAAGWMPAAVVLALRAVGGELAGPGWRAWLVLLVPAAASIGWGLWAVLRPGVWPMRPSEMFLSAGWFTSLTAAVIGFALDRPARPTDGDDE